MAPFKVRFYPLVERAIAGDAVEIFCGQAQSEITDRGRVQNRRVQNGREIRHRLFVELELLGFGGNSIQRLPALSIGLLLVGQKMCQGDPAMAANQTIRNYALLKQPDQVGPRYVEKFGSLVGGQFSADL